MRYDDAGNLVVRVEEFLLWAQAHGEPDTGAEELLVECVERIQELERWRTQAIETYSALEDMEIDRSTP